MNDSFNITVTLGISDFQDVFDFDVPLLTLVLGFLGTFICMIGIIGNIFSIIVLCKKSMKKLSTYSYLLGLSICDEISLVLTVFIFLDYLAPFLLKNLNFVTKIKLINSHKIFLFYIYPVVSSTQALSVWITLAFTVDRYLYVCKPFIGVKYCTRQRASFVIICLYILASIYSIPQFFERTYVRIDLPEQSGLDRLFLSLTKFGRNYYFVVIYHLFIYSVFVTLIPFFIIILLNGFLVYEIIKSRRRHRKLSHTSIRYSDEGKIKLERNLLSPSSCFLFKNLKKKSSDISSADNNNILDSSNEACLGTVNNAAKNSITSQRSVFNIEKHLRNDVTLMLVGLIVVFFICQAPSTILRLITFKNLKMFFKPSYQSTLDISNFLVVFNSTLNCILYVMLGKKFRLEFLKTFCPKVVKNEDLYYTTAQTNRC